LSVRRPPLAIVIAAVAFGAARPEPRANAQTRGDKVPGVVMSPKAAEGAPLVEARVAEVTVFSDRARVRRRGHATGKAGVELVRFPSLPGAVFLDTIRVSTSGGRVLRVEATPVERERMSIAQAGKLLDQLDAVNDRIVEMDDRRAADDWEVGFLRALSPAMPVPEEKREGRKNLVADPASWWKALDFVGERNRAASGRMLKLEAERRDLIKERDRLLADVQALNQGGFSDRVVDVVAIVDLARAGAELELEYFVPGARWKPAYDLHFASARGQIRVETAAVVEQTTGEDWTDATLLLSTAMPGRGIDLPELLTWTLGERSEFVPQLRPRRPPVVEPPPPAPPLPAGAAAARAVVAELIKTRLVSAIGGGTDRDGDSIPDSRDGCPDQPEDRNGFEDADGCPDSDRYVERQAQARARARAYKAQAEYGAVTTSAGPPGAPAAAPAMPAPAAPPPPPPSDAYEEAEVVAESKPRTTLTWQESVVVPRKASKSTGAYRAPVTLALALDDTTAPSRAPVLTDPYLPAVSAGGLDYVYQAPTKATVPSSPKQVRIPLASQTFKATAFHEATPALATTAFLRARVRNDGKRPLLRGPATIFGDGELVGVGELQTTGPGGDIEFPLGADQDVKLVRQIVPSTKTTGVIMKAEETTYDVQIQVANYKKQKVTVEIVDQVPRSRRDKVEVKLLGIQPAATGAPDADGVVRWRVELAPGATQKLNLRYQITRPKDWQLHQN
jgi:hypothetical protein